MRYAKRPPSRGLYGGLCGTEGYSEEYCKADSHGFPGGSRAGALRDTLRYLTVLQRSLSAFSTLSTVRKAHKGVP
jgi:hypothetical protein